jgi:hypothetical protein
LVLIYVAKKGARFKAASGTSLLEERPCIRVVFSVVKFDGLFFDVNGFPT